MHAERMPPALATPRSWAWLATAPQTTRTRRQPRPSRARRHLNRERRPGPALPPHIDRTESRPRSLRGSAVTGLELRIPPGAPGATPTGGRPPGQDSVILHQADFNHAYLTRFTPCSNTKCLIFPPFPEFVWFSRRSSRGAPARYPHAPCRRRSSGRATARRSSGWPRRGCSPSYRRAVTAHRMRSLRGRRPAATASLSEHGTTR